MLAVTVAFVLLSMAYSLWWPAVVRHDRRYWMTPGDLWATVRTAHWVGWGAFSYVYDAHAGLVTLPAYALVLTPIVMLCSALGLSEVSPHFAYGPPHPSAWLLVGPFSLLSVALALFGVDALARAVGASPVRRRILAVAVAAAMWPTLADWGHPEDAVALGLAAYALVAAFNRKWTPAGWLLGAAIAMQLYVVLLVPLFLGMAGARKAGPLLARAGLAPGFFLVVVLVPNFASSIRALLDQPNFPQVDHATPLSLIAPRLANHAVAAGPGRVLAFVAAVGIGVLARKRRSEPLAIVWLAGAAMAARCVFESVIDPYYVMPAVVLVLVAACTARGARWLLCACAAATLTVVTYWHLDMWVYWGSMAALLGAMLAVTRPPHTWPAEVDPVRPALPDELHAETLSIPFGVSGETLHSA